MGLEESCRGVCPEGGPDEEAGAKKPIVANNRRGVCSSGERARREAPVQGVVSEKGSLLKRLKKWCPGEREKILSLPPRARLDYIWDYYKLWIIGILAALFLLIYISYRAFFAVTDFWIYAPFASTTADAGNGSWMWRDFVDYSGYDTREKLVQFNAASFFDPSKEGGTMGSYFQSFVAATEAGDLDLVTLPEPGLVALGESGRLLDLKAGEAGEIFAPYEERFVYCTPYDEEYSTEPVAIGIDLTDSRLMREYGLYEDSCVLGVGAYTHRPEAVVLFLEWALEGGEG